MAREGGLGLAPILGALAILIGGICAAVFWPHPPTSLRNADPVSGDVGDVQGLDAPARPWIVGGTWLCVAHGTVSVTDVELMNASHLRVVDWGVGSEGDLGPGSVAFSLVTPHRVSDLRVLDANGKPVPRYTHRPITGACSPLGPRGTDQRLVLSVERTAPIGYARGIIVQSTSGTVTIARSLALCADDCPKHIPYNGTP